MVDGDRRYQLVAMYWVSRNFSSYSTPPWDACPAPAKVALHRAPPGWGPLRRGGAPRPFALPSVLPCIWGSSKHQCNAGLTVSHLRGWYCWRTL